MHSLVRQQLVVVVVAAVVAAVEGSPQAASVTCTSQRTKYFTVTVTQTMTKLLMRPDDPHDLVRRLEKNLLIRSLPQPVHGYLPPPAHGYLPPPGHGYLPPPAHGYLPPPGHGHLPPRTPSLITITPTSLNTASASVVNIIVTPCRCDMCSLVVQENPCQCAPDFGCGGRNEARFRNPMPPGHPGR